jgi:hypothetical protein
MASLTRILRRVLGRGLRPSDIATHELENLVVEMVRTGNGATGLARAVREMAQTGKGTDECLGLGALPVPVHFYSPIPDLKDLEARKVWDRKSDLAGIDFRPEKQLELLAELGRLHGDECRWSPTPTGVPHEFHTENGCFCFGCAAVTHTMIRRFKPRRVIEAGSGNSTKVIGAALKLNEKDGAPAAEYTVVDPYVTELTQKVPGVTRPLKERIEVQPLDLFASLRENDVLFIDSGHSVRIGSDVNYLVLDVLPRLAPGVIVHFHDVGLPYEYAKIYATNPSFRMFWTEAYLLQAFLAFNSEFEVLLALTSIQMDHAKEFAAAFKHYDPQKYKGVSGSFWIRRKPRARS